MTRAAMSPAIPRRALVGTQLRERRRSLGVAQSALAARVGISASYLNLIEANIVKLASNENPLGMSAAARDAAQQSLGDLARYPDGNGFDLKQALSETFDVPAEWITLGNGSNDILEIAARALLHPGVSAVYSEHAFAVYPLATQASGARAIVVPARDYGHDLDAIGYRPGLLVDEVDVLARPSLDRDDPRVRAFLEGDG